MQFIPIGLILIALISLIFTIHDIRKHSQSPRVLLFLLLIFACITGLLWYFAA